MAYSTRAQVRALDTLSGSPAAYTDAMIDDGILWADLLIDAETGTSWEYKAHTVTRDGNGMASIDTGVLFVREITSSTEDGVAVSTTGWTGTETGWIRRATGSGVFPTAVTGRNVVLVFTAGATSTPPADVAWASRTLARWYCLQLLSRTPANVLQTVTDMGTVTHVQPGGPFNNATALPDINQLFRRANRYHKVMGFG